LPFVFSKNEGTKLSQSLTFFEHSNHFFSFHDSKFINWETHISWLYFILIFFLKNKH